VLVIDLGIHVHVPSRNYTRSTIISDISKPSQDGTTYLELTTSSWHQHAASVAHWSPRKRDQRSQDHRSGPHQSAKAAPESLHHLVMAAAEIFLRQLDSKCLRRPSPRTAGRQAKKILKPTSTQWTSSRALPYLPLGSMLACQTASRSTQVSRWSAPALCWSQARPSNGVHG